MALIKVGSSGGSDINVECTLFTNFYSTQQVTLSADYATLCPLGYPTRPAFMGASPSNADYPKTIANGSVVLLAKGEAAALIAAGKAS